MSLRRLFQREHWHKERAEELDSYLEIETDRNIEAGMAPSDARAAAHRKLGNTLAIRETIHDMDSLPFLDTLRRDLRITVRSLRRRPGFVAIVVLSLALGIGANAAIFSVVDAILLRPLPIPNSAELITLDTAASRLQNYGSSSYLDFIDFSARAKSFQELVEYQEMSAGMSLAGTVPNSKPDVVSGLLVSGNFFSALGVEPTLGRSFLPAEDQAPGKYPVVVISHSFWKRACAETADIVGKSVKLNGHPFTIIGVAPEAFSGPNLFFRPDVYVPTMMSALLMPDGADVLTHRSYRGFNILGRLKAGVTLEQAQAEMDTIMRGLEVEHPETNKDNVVYVRNEMKERTQGGGVLMPAVLMCLVTLVLLIACANIAGLMMAKATSRMREISTQLALGATRACLVRQFLTESALLACAGGLCGVLVAYGSIQAFTALLPFSFLQNGPEFRLDWRVFCCAGLASLVAVFLCGLVPALTAVREARSAMVSRTAGPGGERSSSFIRRILIGGQVALSAILLIAAGLFVKAFVRAKDIDLGFNPDHVLLTTVDPSLRGYSTPESVRFNEQIRKNLETLPQVKSVSMATHVPFVSGASWDLSIDGYSGTGGEKFLDLATNAVGPGYFSTMQIPLLTGREFNERDLPKATQVVIVNEKFARSYLVQGRDIASSIGHIVRLRGDLRLQVVGVVKDSNYGAIGIPTNPVFYVPYLQQGGPSTTFVVRTTGTPANIAPDVRRMISTLDSEIAPTSISSFSAQVSSEGLLVPRMVATTCGTFGILALLLAGIGVYGVVSFLVGRRVQEIGIRMALGAQRNEVLKMVVMKGISYVGAGLLIGIFSAYVLTPIAGDMLIGVSPRDPGIFLSVIALMVGCSLVASWAPAKRATEIDPMQALRHE